MNELEKQLAVILEKSIKVAEKTGEFAIEQAPLLLQEFYTWHIVKSIVMILVFFTSMYIIRVISLTFGLKSLPEKTSESPLLKSKERYLLKPNGRYYAAAYSYGDECNGYSAYIALNIIKYFGFIGVFIWSYNLLYILIAPKLYLIDYFIN